MDAVALETKAEALLGRLAEVLPRLPGAQGIYLYGSRASGTGDVYSDFDVRVVTSSLAACVAAQGAALAKIAPVELEWPSTGSEGEGWSTVFFSGQSHYHSLDLTLVELSRHTVPRGDVPLWEGTPGRALDGADRPSHCRPEPGSPGHFLTGQVISAVRYVRARKRGRHLTCWRFASALADWLAVALSNATVGPRGYAGKLTTWEYAELDEALEAQTAGRYRTLLDFATPADMDRCVVDLLVWLADIVAAQGEDRVPGPRGAMEGLLSFVRAELGFSG